MDTYSSGYDAYLVCMNGHDINQRAGSDPEHNAKFCPTCGEATICACPACQSGIRGDFFDADGIGHWKGCCYRPPQHCHNCGKPYPWTQRRAEALLEALDELDELTPDDRERLKSSIPDILADTPKSETAALRFKKAIAKLGGIGGKMLTDVLAKVATDAIKKSMGL